MKASEFIKVALLDQMQQIADLGLWFHLAKLLPSGVELIGIVAYIFGEMKIAVVTAIFGDMEKPKPFCEQSVPCDRYVFTPENTPFPLPNLPPRLQAKYFKLQTHRVLPRYDCFVWIDGNIEITSPDFVKVMTDGLYDNIRIQKHHERATIGEEIEYILASENPYLKARYDSQPLAAEYGYYLSGGMPADAPLYSCNLFAWDFKLEVAPFFDDWWDLVLRWSWFDQSAFSAIAHSEPHMVEIVDLGAMFDNPYFILHPHDKWEQ